MTKHLISFNRQQDAKQVQGFLLFAVTDGHGEHKDIEVPIQGGEDMTRIMKAFLEKKWHIFLPSTLMSIGSTGVDECILEGIRIAGEKPEGSFETILNDGFNRHVVKLDEGLIVNESKEKFLKVRDFILNL